MPLKDLYAKLLSIGHIAHIPIPLMQPPFHVWCKPGLTYEYHASNPCYGIEIYYAFKKKLMELIKIGWVTFEDLRNVNSNLLPNHAIWNNGVSMVEVGIKDMVSKVSTKKIIWRAWIITIFEKECWTSPEGQWPLWVSWSKWTSHWGLHWVPPKNDKNGNHMRVKDKDYKG